MPLIFSVCVRSLKLEALIEYLECYTDKGIGFRVFEVGVAEIIVP
jgi:hypothetical protein